MNPVHLKRTVSILFKCTPLAFLWIACWVTFYPVARRRSRRQLPEIVDSLGLRYSSASQGSVGEGTIEGTIDGYQVQIEPDRGELIIDLNHWKNVEINDQKPYHECREDLCEISTQRPIFDTIFRTRRACPTDVVQFSGDTQLVQALEQFYMRWLWRIQLFRIDDHALTCQLNCGQPMSAYLPALALEPLLDELCRLAHLVEDKLANKPE